MQIICNANKKRSQGIYVQWSWGVFLEFILLTVFATKRIDIFFIEPAFEILTSGKKKRISSMSDE